MTSGQPAAQATTQVGLDRTIDRSIDHLISLQSPSGYWWAELESNVTITAEHVFLRHILDNVDPEESRRAANYILSQQRADGTWGNWYEGPAELSTTVEAYLALKMSGLSVETPEMTAARTFILSYGGIERVRVFTKIWLAMMGEWDWNGIPVLPPELILLPLWFPINIYSFACWARQTIVPMSIIISSKPVVRLPAWARLDELFAHGRENANLAIRPTRPTALARCFLLLDKALRVLERLPLKPLRKRALAVAERWILERQESDGAWGGIQPPWVYSMIALKLRGHGLDEGPLAKAFAGFYGDTGFVMEDEGSFHVQSCLSPVWDTGLALVAIEEAGLPSDHPAVIRGAEWLLNEQIFTGGDWQVHCKARPGGWAFEFANDNYPDVDDTAIVMIALMNATVDPAARARSIDRGREWLTGMQSHNGGWAAFDRNNTQTWTRRHPFCDFGEVIDPPSVDVSAHVIECLGRLGVRKGNALVDRALAYIRHEQEPDGAWFGRWGVNLTYGIGGVLPGLQAVGEEMAAPYVRRAIDWLIDHQNEDGGWGERIDGYNDPTWRGRGPSTASQTAWALLGLLAAGEHEHRSTERGIEYLIETQREDGGWDEAQFTGTGFPTDFMIRYHLYPDVFPLMALGRYRRAKGTPT